MIFICKDLRAVAIKGPPPADYYEVRDGNKDGLDHGTYILSSLRRFIGSVSLEWNFYVHSEVLDGKKAWEVMRAFADELYGEADGR